MPAPAHRGVHDFSEPALPAEATLDTSVVVDALIATQHRNPAASAYLDRLTARDTTLVVSTLLAVELREVAYKTAGKALFGAQWPDQRHTAAVLADGERLSRSLTAAWETLLDGVDVVIVEPGEVTDRVDDLVTYGLSSYDAVHAATAQMVGTNLIVTTDTDFARVPAAELAVVTAPDLVARCRAIRSTHAAP